MADGDDGDIFVYTGGQAPNDVRRARIAESIDTIAEWAFADCEKLIEVEGHDKLKKIEFGVFIRCRSLRWLTKMGGVIEIEAEAFLGCEALSDFDFDKLEIVGDSSFFFCQYLRSIDLVSIRRVGDGAFSGCEAITEAKFGKDLEIIESDAFYECTALRRIAIPLKDGVIVEDRAFSSCENLTRVDIVKGIHNTISSLHMESWRNEMKEGIDQINQTLQDVQPDEKTTAIQQWIRSVIDRMEYYRAEHQILLKEASTLLELALWKVNLDGNKCNGVPSQEGVRTTRGQVKRARKEKCITSGASVIIKNVLPFLVLQ